MDVMALNTTMKGALLVVFCMFTLGVTDNFVKFFADELSVWQFHFLRGIMIAIFMGTYAVATKTSLRPKNARVVAVRSILYGIGMFLYFGAIGSVPVSIAAAGLFLAPIFVLIFSTYLFRQPIGIYRIIAVMLGFAGVLTILRPFGAQIDPLAIMPVIGAVFYALAMLVTSTKCQDEETVCLVFWFFMVLGVLGVIGMVGIAVTGLADQIENSFLIRPVVLPSATAWFWILMQAIGSIIAISSQTRGYQMVDASTLSAFEYSFLLFASIWGWILWSETLGPWDMVGMAMITVAGIVIAYRSRQVDAAV